MSPVAVKTKRRSARGNWLIVSIHNHEIWLCRWVQTWAGAQTSKRYAQRYIDELAKLYHKEPSKIGRVLILDIERMMDFAVTEAANEINDLYRLFEK